MATKKKGQDESELARLFVIGVTLPNGSPYEFNLHDVSWIDYEDLSAEVAGQSQRYAFHAMLHVGVKDALRRAKAAVSRYAVDVSESVRESLGKGATETLVKQTIAARDEYKVLEARVAELEATEDRFGVVREALVHRRDMLQSAAMLKAPEIRTSSRYKV